MDDSADLLFFSTREGKFSPLSGTIVDQKAELTED